MTAVLLIAAILFGVSGLLFLSKATSGVGLIAFACLLAIFARIVQASSETSHEHTREASDHGNEAPAAAGIMRGNRAVKVVGAMLCAMLFGVTTLLVAVYLVFGDPVDAFSAWRSLRP